MDRKQGQQLGTVNNNNDEDVMLQKIKANVHRKLLEVLDLNEAQRIPLEQLQNECSRRVDTLLGEQKYPSLAPKNKNYSTR